MAASGERAKKDSGENQHTRVSRGATPTLTELGIPRDRASRAMQLADVPGRPIDQAATWPPWARRMPSPGTHQGARIESQVSWSPVRVPPLSRLCAG